jgi:hypothetical protein
VERHHVRVLDAALDGPANLTAWPNPGSGSDRQIEYGREKNVPWGISESGYYRFDANQFYQYRAFGVPGLGYKRGLADDLVITPHASLLALPLRPRAVLQNMERLKRLGMLGMYGFYEAADFTPARLAAGQQMAIVQSYMAHHQGMIMLSLVNLRRIQWFGASRATLGSKCRAAVTGADSKRCPDRAAEYRRITGLAPHPAPQPCQSLASGSAGAAAKGALPLEWSLQHPDYRRGRRIQCLGGR